jgi:hypothetical protein
MRAIGLELRAKYADIIAEGVPERFIAILRRLDEVSDEGSALNDSPNRFNRRRQHNPQGKQSSVGNQTITRVRFSD